MKFLTMTQAAKAIRHLPRRFTASTIWRWVRYGLTTPSGHVVYLRHIKLGGGLFTTTKWLDEFFRDAAEEDRTGWRHTVRRPARRHNARSRHA